jgi:curved DNA-binding protein
MADRDYYEILGVARDADPEQIKKAYRAMARKHHPDVNPGNKESETLFKEAQQAYDVLGDPEKRKLYDRLGRAGFEGMGSAGPRAGATEWASAQGGPGPEFIDLSQFFGPGAQGFTAGVNPEGAENLGGGLFGDLFGRLRPGRGGRRGPRAPRPTEASLTIPFLTAVKGGETTIELTRADGRHETLGVKIPPGTEPGAKLRLRGRGEPAEPGGTPGDLIIHVDVEPHPTFTRQGRDVQVEVPISVPEAILGARVEVPTLDGAKTVPIPAGTSCGQKLRLRGQGVPATSKQPAGDLFVVPRIVVPKSIDDESRQLIQQFAERNPQRPREGTS